MHTLAGTILMGGALAFIGIFLLIGAGIVSLVVTVTQFLTRGPVIFREASDQMEKDRKRLGILREIEEKEAELKALKATWKERVDENRKTDVI